MLNVFERRDFVKHCVKLAAIKISKKSPIVSHMDVIPEGWEKDSEVGKTVLIDITGQVFVEIDWWEWNQHQTVSIEVDPSLTESETHEAVAKERQAHAENKRKLREEAEQRKETEKVYPRTGKSR
jgi:hypothetical protein